MKNLYLIILFMSQIILDSCSAGTNVSKNCNTKFEIYGDDLIISKKIIHETDGSILITGCTQSALFNNHLTGNMDYFIAKLNKKMNVIFFKQLGKANQYMCSNSIAVDKAHNIYVIGDIVNTASNFFITKFSGINGELLWQYKNNNINNNYGTDILVTDQNDIYFGGKKEENNQYDAFYGMVSRVNNCSEMCPVDYNINPNIKFLGDDSKTITNIISNNSLQYIYALGNSNQGNVIIYKIDKYNNKILDHFVFKDSNIIFEPQGIIIAKDYLYFTTHNEINDIYGELSSMLWKINFDGQLIWKKNIKNISTNGVFSLNGISTCSKNNYLFITGYTSVPFNQLFPQIGIHDSFVVTYDINGNFINYTYWGNLYEINHNSSIVTNKNCISYILGDTKINNINTKHNLYIKKWLGPFDSVAK